MYKNCTSNLSQDKHKQKYVTAESNNRKGKNGKEHQKGIIKCLKELLLFNLMCGKINLMYNLDFFSPFVNPKHNVIAIN